MDNRENIPWLAGFEHRPAAGSSLDTPQTLRYAGDMTVAPKILIIEDERDIQDLVRHYLEKDGFRTRTASDGDAGLAARIRTLVNQGQDGRYNHVTLGYNYRMTEMQAALGASQLKRIGHVLSEKERVASAYDRAFATAPGVEVPARPPYATAQSWFMYSVRLPDLAVRDAAVEALAKRGIETRLGFPPVHIQPYYRERFGYRPGDLPVSFRAWQRKLDIPAWPGLPERDQKEIAGVVIAETARARAASRA